MSDTKQVLIKARSLTQEFFVGNETITPLKNVSVDIQENSFNIIYGPSGSGKSSLLNAMAGLQNPTAGTVEFQGRDIYKLTPDELAHFRANHIGIIYQDNYWVKSLSVVENVCLPLYFIGYSRKVAYPIAMQALERVSMTGYAKKPPFVLSLGEQQRVAAARALVNNPLFIIADEPTGNLDRKNGDHIMDLLQRCKTEFKCTVVLVTHNLEYLPIADSLFQMQDGVISQVKSGEVESAAEELLKDIRNRIDRFKEVKK